jgi:hypothetical protein
MNLRVTAKFGNDDINIKNINNNENNLDQYLFELEQNSKLFDEKIEKLFRYQNNQNNNNNNKNSECNILELETKEIDTDNLELENINNNNDNLKYTFNPSNNIFQSMISLDKNYENDYNELKKKIQQLENEISYKDELINELRI